ncbi:signal recognition particle protein [Cocleimonas sp. KMM 6892]|jgi:signal recognition particle subunit SRP54|uniref:signal recognition particle protein n=1 Tax=unclassified Cocleimonas TaxID=2639732 RepID=UPI002DBAF111|nr:MULTISPECIES: signal recognition particle protein [unclassified Cocleimonas]MEB8432919.1 signal recognition particle protein [Cocleimonas sp. KMM 6892]MEC4716100.1 signal recognition particle protein [Cocleimonas sp. KMM 6895]MEC4745561.1 signal recognition particle protein [Cocleimonas sp. KMM 6896]
MFENLSDRLSHTVKKLKGQARLTEDNIKEAMREVRMALLEADVALPVVRTFVDKVKERAIGVEVQGSLSPGQALVKVVNDELVKIMGEANESLDLNAQPPAVVLMAGLQGAGKTTTAGKLAKLLQEREKKTVAMVSCDVYRPAAIKQLQTLAGQVEATFIESDIEQSPVDIAIAALDYAKRNHIDVLLVDTAGRLHVDADMMDEIQLIHAAVKPVETLFVVDAMTGQDAANTAKAFGDALPLTGVVLTKADGDARGGAALSVREVTGKPIKFIGMGEKIDELEPFHPERMASRILGMGDVLSLVEEAQRKVDHKDAQQLAKKLNKGKGFDLEDLRNQMLQMQKMGGMGGLMDKLPGMGKMTQAVQDGAGDKEVNRMVAIINSMTPKERRFPAVIKGSHKKRIAAGCGLQIQDVNRLLKQHKQMSKMMKKFKGGGLKKMMRGMKGQMPPGMGGGGGFPGM